MLQKLLQYLHRALHPFLHKGMDGAHFVYFGAAFVGSHTVYSWAAGAILFIMVVSIFASDAD